MVPVKIKFYGTRGSCPSISDESGEFGGNTTCLLFTFGEKKIMLDIGSGAAQSLKDLKNEKSLDVLISHLHLDHLGGVVSLIPAFAGRKLNVYGKARSGVSVKDAVSRIMSEPIWPVTAEQFGCTEYHDVPSSFTLGGVRIDTMESGHPGGSTIYRFTYDGRIIVSAFDFTHLNGGDEKLAQFAKGCNILIYDGAMNDEEFALHPTWGHSTANAGINIAKKCGCRLIVTHHGPYATDKTLLLEEAEARAKYENTVYAKDGMSVEL